MEIDAELTLNWSAVCVRQERVVLTLGDGEGHTATADMSEAEARDLAHVLVHEMHGSCPDVWLVERQARSPCLWLTLSATARGMVRISRIELDSAVANQVADSLLAAAVQCRPAPALSVRWRKSALELLHTTARWVVLHTWSLARRITSGWPADGACRWTSSSAPGHDGHGFRPARPKN